VSEDTDWNSNLGGGFGQHKPEDEYFHGTGPAGDTLTETWYWNFHVPEAAINCFAYCWVHPNLKVVSGGCFLYKGQKDHHLQSEMFDYRTYMAMDVLGQNGGDICFPNGMRVQALESLEHLRFTFDDPDRRTRFDIDLKAVGVPIMRANNKHFEQVMHATGKLTLRGENYDVDCYPVRDRSWGELRPESNAHTPPYTWVTGTFGEDFAFNVGSLDDPARGPEWVGVMNGPANGFKDGWLVIDGEQRRIVKSSKLTNREGPINRPMRHDYTFEDDHGDTYHITGEIIAQVPWGGWANSVCHCGLTKWDWNGRTGWGETQEVVWNEYLYGMKANG
jgi:hypothetical protein